MWARLSLRFKLTFLVASVVAVSSYSFGKVMFSGLTELLDKVTGLRAETVSETLADVARDSWPDLQKAVASGSGGGLQTRLATRVSRLVNEGWITRVEVIEILDKQTAQYLLNIPADDSPDYHPPGSTDILRPGGLYSQDSGHYAVELSVGPTMAGMSSIVRDGEAVGKLIVYVDISDVQATLDYVQIAILVVMFGFILLSGLVAFKFATSFEKTAVTDGLMGIYNHKYFKQRLEEEVAKSARYGQQTAIVLLDIDFFKRVNDTYGHATGDLVLKSLARIVSDTCRNTDVVARYGGEEVACILPHTGMAGAQEFAERLRIKISQHVIRDPEEDAEFRVTVSVGVAQWEKGLKMLDLIKRADAALYHSKETGRNRVTIYQDEILPDTKTGS